MNELTNAPNGHKAFRWQLLATVSTLAILGSAYAMGKAQAANGDEDRPVVWIELGGQLEQMNSGEEPYAPAFTSLITQNGYLSPVHAEENKSNLALGEQASLTFQPTDSDWIFSASVRFGRYNSQRDSRTQKTEQLTRKRHISIPAIGEYRNENHLYTHTGYSQTESRNNKTSTVVDFQAGKDVGIGFFGSHSTSDIQFGVRFAQFTSRSTTKIDAQPDYRLVPRTNQFSEYIYRYNGQYIGHNVHGTNYEQWRAYHRLHAQESSARSFHGIGPSISWDASSALMGNGPGREITFDWGANAAVLFGRQRAQTHHQSATRYIVQKFVGYSSLSTHTHVAAPSDRVRSVIVPNLGGFAGLSFRYANAKLSLGYRGDFFFGAMDGGIDTRKSENIGFYGPFATISIGLP